MATEDDTKRSKFLKKSKWGKLFKENDTAAAGGPGGGGGGGGGAFKLADDVQDFLKPSTEKNVPKLDIALAKRWPDAHEVRLVAATDDNHATKPKKRRKEGLTVSFAKTLPEIMGEGGDEAPDPPQEISRRKAMLSRSVSDRKTAALPDGAPWPKSSPLPNVRLPPEPTLPSVDNDELFVPPPQLKRSQTANMDFSTPLQRKFASPAAQEVEPYRPSLGRTPTGPTGIQNQQRTGENQDPLSKPRPTVDTQFQQSKQEPYSAFSTSSYGQTPEDVLPVLKADHLVGPDGSTAISPVAAKRREMSTSEGMVLRRASMLIHDDTEDDDRASSSVGPLHSLTSQASYSSTHEYQPQVYEEPVATPATASTSSSLNPFADPNYTSRHTRQSSREPQHRPTSKASTEDRVVPQVVSPVYSHRSATREENPAAQRESYRAFNPSQVVSRSPVQSATSDRTGTFFSTPNGSSNSVNAVPPTAMHVRNQSRDGYLQPAGLPSNHYMQSSGHGRNQSSSDRNSHQERFSASTAPLAQPQPTRSPVALLRHENRQRPLSGASHQSLGREDDPAAEAAYSDFTSRVSHMRGVFRLTAEKEQPTSGCTSMMWLRAGLWWYLKGKAGLEIMLQQRDHRPLLSQAHVDLGKASWILMDQLEMHDDATNSSDQGVSALRNHLKSLSLSMTKNHLLPPEQSLIQGQDTSIWLQYPRFTSDAAAVLGGSTSNSVIVDERNSNTVLEPYELLPLGDSREFFCYGRFPVDVYINTDEADTDRALLPCILTVLRSRRDYQTSMTIASQNLLVGIKIEPFREGKRALTWSDVSWKPTGDGFSIRLPRNFDAAVQMQARHCRDVWNLSEYARKVEHHLQASNDEVLVYEARLVELQYADSANSGNFPAEKMRGCMVFVFEKVEQLRDGNGLRKFNRGFRVALITDPGHKTLSAVDMDVGAGAPVLFEFLTSPDPAAGVGLLLRKRDGARQCRALMVLPSAEERERLFGLLNGAQAGVDDMVVGRTALAGLRIEATDQTRFAEPDVLQHLQWSSLTVFNTIDDETEHPTTVESDHLRFVAKHAAGTITDRLNLSKGELLLRLIPSLEGSVIQLLRQPQADMTLTVDTRRSPQPLEDKFARLLQTVQTEPTLRTLKFASQSDLHAFQRAITGFTVCFDGIASTFGISRRRMVVPIYKKWEAVDARVQVVSKDGIYQICAFMQGFKHTDAMCFRVKSTDVFESFSGKKSFGVKFVDAKFTLPKEEGREEPKRLFINLEGLDYAEEHDDISVGFEREEDRDRFAKALPAATTSVSRGLTMKRRI
ncbi:uncharacterized protein RCC_06642 [Ramularia collo-cygni]|uniref:Uncharacterized protein n=1 Tax=Ramularia collo-cygni TaxID=112498 RepID=A0A2D3VDC0_9PEZI|nr:uncharacterized protein RCC_06642 [Ramularia collo-cygni]CZT20784.1 uncharacterized protein RCC_06642 [Ramularia collo-cygni]